MRNPLLRMALYVALCLMMGCAGGLPGGPIDITCSPSPLILGSPPAYATVDYPYSAQFTGVYNCGLGVCFSLEAVTLPPGAEIDNYLKCVTWTPRASLASTTQQFKVRTPPDACGDSATFAWTVEVLPPIVLQSFTANPPAVHPGGTTLLTPVYTGGSGWIDQLGGSSLGEVASGSAVLTPPLTGTTTFVLSVSNSAGALASRPLTVKAPQAPVISNFTATPAAITLGSWSTLFWDVTDGDALRLDPGALDMTGRSSTQVSPSTDTTYTLTATNALGEHSQASVTVAVVRSPSITSFNAFPSETGLLGQVQLTAVFQDGSGVISGLGAVQSGVPVTSPPLLGRTYYALVVTNAAGAEAVWALEVPVTGPGTFQELPASLIERRSDHSATLLPDGRVLIAGGQGSGGTLDTTEIFDPWVNTFTRGPRLLTPRAFHQAVLLPQGRVLLAGGSNTSGALTTAEVLDPAGPSQAAGTLPSPTQNGSTSAALPGGDAFLLLNGRAARYLTSTNSFLDLGELASVLGGVITLRDGRVLVVNLPALLFDPSSDTFSPTGSPLHSPFWSPGSALLPDDRVFSGWDGSAEVWSPSSGSFTSLGATGLQTATALKVVGLLDGRVLVLQLDGTRLFDPTAGFSPGGNLGTPRTGHTATLLPEGRVLIVGGLTQTGYATSIEAFQP